MLKNRGTRDGIVKVSLLCFVILLFLTPKTGQQWTVWWLSVAACLLLVARFSRG